MADDSVTRGRGWLRAWFEPAILLTIVGLLVAITVDNKASHKAELERAEDSKQSKVLEKRAIAPFLSVISPYHETKVMLHKDVERHSQTLSYFLDECLGLRSDLAAFHASQREALSSFGVVKNSGGGPAFDVKVEWIVDFVSYNDGSKKVWLEKEIATEEFAWRYRNIHSIRPMQLQPGESGSISVLPAALEADTKFNVGLAFGEIEIRCKDLTDRSHIFRQEFSAHTSYDAARPAYKASNDAWKDSPGVIFRYWAVTDRDGPYPHRGDDKLRYGDASLQDMKTFTLPAQSILEDKPN